MLIPTIAAALAAAILSLVWAMRRARGWIVLAALWGAYALYESLMYARVLCSGECNIRVDLLLIWPLLVFTTLYAVVRAVLRRRK